MQQCLIINDRTFYCRGLFLNSIVIFSRIETTPLIIIYMYISRIIVRLNFKYVYFLFSFVSVSVSVCVSRFYFCIRSYLSEYIILYLFQIKGYMNFWNWACVRIREERERDDQLRCFIRHR